MNDRPGITEDSIVATARRRGLALDAERATALRAPAESLLARLARFADLLPREAAPPPLGPVPDRAP